MRSSKITCDRCGAEPCQTNKIEVYSIIGHSDNCSPSIDAKWDLCDKCTSIVNAAFAGVANSVFIHKPE